MSDTAGSRRDGSVDQLLVEADLAGDAQLRPVLLELRALGSVAPEPTAELLALMAGSSSVAAAKAAAPAGEPPADPADELAARRRAKRRVTLTALSVAVFLGAGGAVAAASDQAIRKSFTEALASFATGSGSAPAGDQGKQPAAPMPTGPAGTAPEGASPADPASVPADPAAATHPTAVPPSDSAAAEGSATRQPTSPGRPGEVPASKHMPGVVPGHVTDGLGGSPVPVPSQVPLPTTLAAVPSPVTVPAPGSPSP
jgi:hypothetical protein